MNLAAKSILSPFNLGKEKMANILDESNAKLSQLIEDLDKEEDILSLQSEMQEGDCDDNLEGWVDEVRLLSLSERKDLANAAQAVKLVLVKVS